MSTTPRTPPLDYLGPFGPKWDFLDPESPDYFKKRFASSAVPPSTVYAATSRELEHWYDKYGVELLTNIDVSGNKYDYYWSPSSDARDQQKWGIYDELEAQRRASGAPRAEWQDQVEQARAKDEELRAIAYRPLDEMCWDYCPLWVYMDRYLGRPDPDMVRRLRPWTWLIPCWNEFRRMYQDDPVFRDGLAGPQRRSYQVLESWWTACYCDSDLPRAVATYAAQFGGTRGEDTTPAGQVGYKNQKLFDDYFREIDPQVLTDTSFYHAACFEVFMHEFYRLAWQPYCMTDQYLARLQRMRITANSMAVMQKMAHAMLHPRNPGSDDSRDSNRPLDSSDAYPIVLQNEADDKGLSTLPLERPFFLWDTQDHKTVMVDSLLAGPYGCPDYVCVSHTWGRWRTNTDASVPGVPWPVPENTRYHVSSLPSQLQGLGSRYVWFDLFCIPQDEKDPRSHQEIAKQSSIFRGSRRCVAYIHDVDSWAGMQKALDWACLQFLRVSSTRVSEAVDQPTLATAAAEAASAPIQLLNTFASVNGENLVVSSSHHRPDHTGLSTWFTSLWTLQECVLCPEIELMSRQWELLEDRRCVPISLRTLVAVSSRLGNLLKLDERIEEPFSPAHRHETSLTRILYGVGIKTYVPASAVDLHNLVLITRLDLVLTMGSSTMVLLCSNLRECTSSRAPAIMSAIGVTDWYKTASGSTNGSTSLDQENSGDLVFGMYPLLFLREAASKLGASFYDVHKLHNARDDIVKFRASRFPLARILHQDLRRSLYGLKQRADLSLPVAGTLLPVSQRAGWKCPIAGSPGSEILNRRDHPSVATWTINKDGSVSITRACVLVTYEPHDGEPAVSDDTTSKLSGAFVMEIPDSQQPKMHPATGRFYVPDVITEDLAADIKKLSVHSRSVYAVVLYTNSGQQTGILLDKLATSAITGVAYLLKIGHFAVLATKSIIPETDVNWRVI